MPRLGKTARRAIRWVLAAVVIAVVGYLFARTLIANWDQIRREELQFDWWWVGATALFAMAVPVTGFLWWMMLRAMDPEVRGRVRLLDAIAVQCASWILKYIPGQVGSFLNKIAWARSRGLSKTLVAISFVYENIFLLLASMVPSIVILLIALGPLFVGSNAALLLLPLVVIPPIVLILYRPFFVKLVSWAGSRVLKAPVDSSTFLRPTQALGFSALFVIPRLFNAVGFIVLAATLTTVTPDMWLPFAAAYTLAGAVGILAVFVPSGLGVREAVIVLILTPYVGAAQAIVISLLARLLSTLGDGLVALLYGVLRASSPKESTP